MLLDLSSAKLNNLSSTTLIERFAGTGKPLSSVTFKVILTFSLGKYLSLFVFISMFNFLSLLTKTKRSALSISLPSNNVI